MNYELKKFEERLKELIQPDPVEFNSEVARWSANWIEKEQDHICSVFKEIIPGKSNAIIKSYFFHHQQSIAFLSDRIYVHIIKLEADDKQQNHRKNEMELMLQALENILTFLETNLTLYFDIKGKVPDSMIENYKTTQTKRCQDLLQSFEEKKTDPALRSILSSMLTFQNKRPEARITFSQFNWVKNLHHQLSLYVITPDEVANDLGLIRLLVTMNLNTAEFYWHCCTGLQKELNAELTVAEQYKKLAALKKWLNQHPKLDVAGYLHGQLSIKVALLKFIKAEIKSLNELELIAHDLVSSGILASNFKVSLSAKQLAFYIFLNVESGIIITEKPKKLHEFIVSHVDSAQKQGLSLKSFKNNYYSHAPADVKKVEERLAGMLALIREKFWMIGLALLFADLTLNG